MCRLKFNLHLIYLSWQTAIARPATPSLPVEISTSDPFARLQKNTTVASINAILVPWLIAEFGMHYADADNVDTAMHMLTHIIVSQQLGGYTASTFSAAIDGHRVEQVAFTKLILKTAGKFCFSISMRDTNSHLPNRKGQHSASQEYSERPHQAALHLA